MSIVQTEKPKGGWRWRFLWAAWCRTLLFLGRYLLPRDLVDWLFLSTRSFTLWCAQDSPDAALRARAQREVDGDR